MSHSKMIFGFKAPKTSNLGFSAPNSKKSTRASIMSAKSKLKTSKMTKYRNLSRKIVTNLIKSILHKICFSRLCNPFFKKTNSRSNNYWIFFVLPSSKPYFNFAANKAKIRYFSKFIRNAATTLTKFSLKIKKPSSC